MTSQHHGMCFLFVRNNYRPPYDVVLRQGMSTDWASNGGHYALLRGDKIIEYMPGMGKRKIQWKNYFQTVSGRRIYAKDGLFVRTDIREIQQICKESGNV